MSMDLESMDNVQGTVDIVHGIFPVSLHERVDIFNSMDIVHIPWTFSSVRITHNPMTSDLTSFSCFT